METEHTQLITTTLETVLGHLGITVRSVTASEMAGSTFFAIETPDSARLIGRDGETLSALNQIVKKMLETKLGRDVHYTIDVNGYHAREIKRIEDSARLTAERARTFRYDIEMPAMSAYERMVVHSCLKQFPDIETQSFGEGALRHIVVRFKEPVTP